MRRYRALSKPLVACSVCRSWVDCIINMAGFDLRQVQGSPWQNGFAERLIGSIRRECLDHVVALGEAHLRRILQTYAGYYNDVRTQRSLDKGAPFSRPVQ
jgi:hypothetical protein